MRSISLYYDKEDDMLHTSFGFQHNTLFTSYEDKGYKQNKPEFIVPSTNFHILIKSNFGYGSSSYLRAYLKDNGIPILNFKNWCDCINCSLSYFEVEPTPKNWEELLHSIANAYNNRASWNYNGIINCINQLIELLSHPDNICIRAKIWSQDTVEWKGNNARLHIIKKTSELVKNIETLQLEDYMHIKEGIISICKKIVPMIISTYKNAIENQSKQQYSIKKDLEINFDNIYNYLKRTNQIDILFGNE